MTPHALYHAVACLTLAVSGHAAGSSGAIADFFDTVERLMRGGAAFRQAAFSSLALSDGLPATIPADLLDREGFLPFEELDPAEAARLRPDGRYAQAPIGVRMELDGVPIDPLDRDAQHRVFAESAYAMLPPGTRIKARFDAAGRTHWDYPVGATVAHLLTLRADPPRVFELRLARKRPDGSWAFGTYSPRDLADQSPAALLELQRYAGLPEVQMPFRPAGSAPGTVSKVKLNRIKLESCRGCHFANSPAAYQYERRAGDAGPVDIPASIAASGPCGFVPNNRHVVGAWAAAFAARFGFPPIE